MTVVANGERFYWKRVLRIWNTFERCNRVVLCRLPIWGSVLDACAIISCIDHDFLMAMPLFGLAWIFQRVGRSLNSKLTPRPWYRLQEDGKIVRYRSSAK
jgi:hypothetical protein